jgi:hypothetical protein
MESLKRFFNMYFVAHDIMSRTAPLDYEDEPEHEWLENDDLDEVCIRLSDTASGRLIHIAGRYNRGLLAASNDARRSDIEPGSSEAEGKSHQ